MLFKIALAALAASPLVAAHGKVAAVTGDAGGNGTALAIKGGVVPGTGSDSKTEVDTTVFKSTNINTDGLGKTTGSGENTVSMVADTMALSGNTLPQVSSSGGSISGTLHIVTTDGAGPFKAVVDNTATGAFSNGANADVTTQVPGNRGNISPDGEVQGGKLRRWLLSRGLTKRAANVNKDYPIAVAIPAGTSCSGTAGTQSNVCFLKIANSNPAGPFGGVIAFQMAGASANTTASSSSASAGTASTAGTASAAKKGAAGKKASTA